MTVLTNMKLVVGKKQHSVNPIVHRRNKLAAKLHEQIELCEAKRNGSTYAPLRMKTYTNKETGERMTVQVAKRVKEWFWVSESGRINLAVKYGAKTLPLNKKGANAIEVINADELRSGPVCLNSDLSILSGISADSHAASLTVGSITA